MQQAQAVDQPNLGRPGGRWSDVPYSRLRNGSRVHGCLRNGSRVQKHQHEYLLDLPVRQRGVINAGHEENIEPLFSKLEGGLPITLGIIGASAAQHAGCFDQKYRRCMNYAGRGPANWIVDGPNHLNPTWHMVKGFGVRLFEHINRSYPHPDHRINNSTLDATPMQHLLPCLFSHMPRALDIVILEFGSMAGSTHANAVEGLARQLLAIPQAPVLIFLSFHEWCQRARNGRRELFQPGERGHSILYPDTPWMRMQNETARVCARYGQPCISQHAALDPEVREKRIPLFDVVGPDCLHIVHGRRGVEFTTDLLVHWFEAARARYKRNARLRRCGKLETARTRVPVTSVPRLRPASASERPGRCYDFRPRDRRLHRAQALTPVVWTTAACASATPWPAPTPSLGKGEGGCVTEPHEVQCPTLKQLHSQPLPRVWFYCHTALPTAASSRKKKKPAIKPGVLALVPGATLAIDLDTRLVSGGEENPSATLDASLVYLTSYEGMGRTSLRCVRGCTCVPRVLDGHRSHPLRNISTFESVAFKLVGAVARCTVQLMVLEESSTGMHKFKVRFLTVVPTSGGSGERISNGTLLEARL